MMKKQKSDKFLFIMYVIIKLIIIGILIYLYVNPSIFDGIGGAYSLGYHGAVVCIGMTILLAIYLTSTLVDDIFKYLMSDS